MNVYHVSAWAILSQLLLGCAVELRRTGDAAMGSEEILPIIVDEEELVEPLLQYGSGPAYTHSTYSIRTYSITLPSNQVSTVQPVLLSGSAPTECGVFSYEMGWQQIVSVDSQCVVTFQSRPVSNFHVHVYPAACANGACVYSPPTRIEVQFVAVLGNQLGNLDVQ